MFTFDKLCSWVKTTSRKKLKEGFNWTWQHLGSFFLYIFILVANTVKPQSQGLLVLTGILWGCTNPFIRQGTKGLRRVHADSKLGQAYAEIVFLLGNFRYVFPWVLNQVGSLVYLAAIQRTPLSLAVPAANSLAFVFTAVTGAAVGAEEPLDIGSYLGIIMIAIGTAVCCWDKTE